MLVYYSRIRRMHKQSGAARWFITQDTFCMTFQSRIIS